MNTKPSSGAMKCSQNFFNGDRHGTSSHALAQIIDRHVQPLVRAIEDALADSAKYPQLEMHKMQEQRLEDALEQWKGQP